MPLSIWYIYELQLIETVIFYFPKEYPNCLTTASGKVYGILGEQKPEPADNLKKYNIKHIPQRNTLKTQNTSQNQEESRISNISVLFQNHHQTNKSYGGFDINP